MSHQGNVLLGYDLAVFVKPKMVKEKDNILDLIKSEVYHHCKMRFCKEITDDQKCLYSNCQCDKEYNKHNSAKCLVVKLMQDRICFDSELHISEIQAPADEDYGKIYVVIPEDDDERKKLTLQFLKHVPEIRIETFSIVNREDINEKVSLNKDTAHSLLYHIASRVCAAFVEYALSPNAFESENKHQKCGTALVPLSIKSIIENKIKPSEIKSKASMKILDIRDAIDLVCEGLDGADSYFPPVPEHMQTIFEGRHNELPSVHTRYKFPFGVWFRGIPRVCFNLRPSLFRYALPPLAHPGCKKLEPYNQVMYDETSMMNHFILHNAELRTQYHYIFEWLCLMQHYTVPTRVLDWSENILTALFFAVCDKNVDCDGALWVLNAGRLNELSRVSTSRRYTCIPSSCDVILRSAMSCSNSVIELRAVLIKEKQFDYVLNAIQDDMLRDWIEHGNDDSDDKILDNEAYKKLSNPVAVFPGRINERLNAQLGTFTLHGGKIYDPKIFKHISSRTRFLKSRSLIELNDWAIDNTEFGRFLDCYIIPSGAKRKLREQLKKVGIHFASLFPELEYQSKYIRKQWRMATDSNQLLY